MKVMTHMIDFKKTFKRAISFMTAFSMSASILFVPETVKELREGTQHTISLLHAYADDSSGISIQNIVNNNASYSKTSVILIDCNNSLTIPADFPGIGTEDEPFEGTIKIQNGSWSDTNAPSYANYTGGDSTQIVLLAPLFNYISDKATIEDLNYPDRECTLYLSPGTLTDETIKQPLFANHVVGDRGTAVNWSIRINSTNQRSTIIGSMDQGTDAPKVNLTVFNEQTELIDGTGNLGAICNTINAGELSVSLPNGIDASTISTTDGNVGGLVGEMADGTKLTINSSITYSSPRSIATLSGYAGGLVGYCEGIVDLGNCSYTDGQTTRIVGTTGAGGVFGYYGTDETVALPYFDKFTVCTTLSTASNTVTVEGIWANGGPVGGFVGVLENKGTSKTITIQASQNTSNSNNFYIGGQNGGGVIGYYKPGDLTNTLVIDTVYAKSNGTQLTGYYGGLIGYIEATGENGGYVEIKNVKIDVNAEEPYPDRTVTTKTGGLIGYTKGGFVDITGNVTIANATYKSGLAGLIYESASGVVRLAGTTNLTAMTKANALLINARGNTLVYAKGDGTNGWTYKRPNVDLKIDDLNPWGQVVRKVGGSDIETAEIVSVSGHIVTLAAAETTMSNAVDFAKTALNIQLNTESKNLGALAFTDTLASSSARLLDSDDLKFGGDIDLTSSGLTGFTRDNGSNLSFTGTLKCGSHTLTLATGEAYGYKGETVASTGVNFGDTGVSTNYLTGAIATHTYNGLFAKVGTCSISDLTLGGKMVFCSASVDAFKVGGLAAEITAGDAVFTGITCGENIFLYDGDKTKYIGFLTGLVSDSTSTTKFDVSNCELTGTAWINRSGSRIGLVGEISDTAIEVTFDDIDLTGTINYTGAGRPYSGGLVGRMSGDTYTRNINLTDIDVNGLTVVTNMTGNNSIDGKLGNPAGGLLGGQWLRTNVFFGNSTASDSVKVTNGTLTLNGNASYAGGLVADATGYWQVNDIDIVSMSISGASDGIGLLVLNGKNSSNGLYLEMTSTSAYSITSVTTPNSVAIYDEIMAFSKGVSYVKETVNNVETTTGFVPTESNGQAVVSIRTSEIGGVPKLSMGSEVSADYLEVTLEYTFESITPNESENPSEQNWYERFGEEGSYTYTKSEDISVDGSKTYYQKSYTQNPHDLGWYEHSGETYSLTADITADGSKSYYERISRTDNSYNPQTTLGSNHNPYTRYYYNLDYLLKNATTGGEKLLLWSVNKYAAGNISGNTKIKSENTNGFSDYSSFPTETSIDLSYLSYYPVDIGAATITSGATVTFHNYEMQTGHGNVYDLNTTDANSKTSQHFLMHAGLFKNVTGLLSASTLTLTGSVSAHCASADGTVAAGSGAIVCGKVSGADNDTNISGVDINGLNLDGIYVNGVGTGTDALIIKTVGDNAALTISGVKTTSSGYTSFLNTDTAYPYNYAAGYLIGEADGTSMTFVFDNIVLDGRTPDSSLYNPTASANSGNTSEAIQENSAYELNGAYHTPRSIFRDSTLLKTLKYVAGSGSSAKYDYKWSEDWGATKHQVTYGYEIDHTDENKNTDGDSKQNKYIITNNGAYTSPVSRAADEEYDFTGFLRYVYTPFDRTNNYHEAQVNIGSVNVDTGCGTYNDPYVVDGEMLAVVANALSDTGSGGFSANFEINIDNDYANYTTKNGVTTHTTDINFEKWCAKTTSNGIITYGHARFRYNGTEFAELQYNTTSGEYEYKSNGKTLEVVEVKDYLAGAYYYVDDDTTLPDSFVGLGGNSARNAFRGVIVGKTVTKTVGTGESATSVTRPAIITNLSDFPLVNVSNGCVVKNITLNITAASITKTSDTAGADGKFGYGATATQYYGGVIGEIMGGDNIIDYVRVTYSSSTAITVGGTAEYNVPMGGYIGVVVNGSVIFRHMTETVTNSETNESTTTVFANQASTGFSVSKTGKSNLQNDVTVAADGTETFTNLYVNPIIGRVINGFAIYESDAYRYSEDGYYVDKNSNDRSTARAASASQTTLKNGRKNFSIPDFNATSGHGVLTFSKSGSVGYNDVVTVSDAQSLYILSLVCQTNMGSASSDSGSYSTSYDSGYEGGSTTYKATHLGYYDDVYSITSKNSNYNRTKSDKANDRSQIPYLIYEYTNHPDDTSDSPKKYPARTLTSTNSSRSSGYTIVLDENASTPFFLPDSFRGIGYIGGQNNVSSDSKIAYIKLNSFVGNGKTIDMNTYFRTYSKTKDSH